MQIKAAFSASYILATPPNSKKFHLQIGLAGMVFSISAAVVSLLEAQVISGIGRKGYLLTIGAVHIAMYMISLFWIPTTTNLWMVYFIEVIAGSGEGSLICFVQGKVTATSV